jgi:threonine/homoserine/homoserine lactone efflux protein
MLETNLLLALIVFAFVSSATPGPNNLMLLASGTNFGFARTLPHMLGVSIGFVAMVIIVGLGLAQFFQAFPIFRTVLKWGSVAYLTYLSWKIATSAAPNAENAAQAKPMTFLGACAFQWVNPKAWTMAFGTISAYVPASSPVMGLIISALVFGLINLPVVASWALLGVQMRKLLDNPKALRIFNVTAAVLLLASLYPVIFDGH